MSKRALGTHGNSLGRLLSRVVADPDALNAAWGLIPPSRRPKFILLVAVQLLLGALDIIAVGLVGFIGSIGVAGIESRSPSGLTARLLHLVGLSSFSLKVQLAIIGLIAATLLLGRTWASITLTRKALHFLALRSAEASADLVSRLLAQPLTYIQSKTSQEYLYAVSAGANALVLGVLGTGVVMLSDLSMLLVISLLLLVVSPVVAIVLGMLLGAAVVALHRNTTRRAAVLGQEGARWDVAGRDLLVEALSTYRDATVRGTRGHYADRLREVRQQAAYASAESTFLPNVSKYVMETLTILAALLVGAVQFAISDAQHAISALAVFLAAGTRLAPAAIRVQQGVFALRAAAGGGQPTIRLMRELDPSRGIDPGAAFVAGSSVEGLGLRVEGVTYIYPGATSPAVAEWSVSANAGALIAFVGPSGAGKSTAADLLLGLLEPQAGTVLIDGAGVKEFIRAHPGAVAYVPQEVWITSGTVRSNVALGYALRDVPDAEIWRALTLAHLDDVVRAFPEQLDAVIGERGTNLSGGQRQRLGIARALLTRPRLLVLDEATSALDATTEHEVTEAIRGLQGQVTLVVIAHRLATVRHADLIQYFDHGAIRASGNFEEVRQSVPDFATQAELLGL